MYEITANDGADKLLFRKGSGNTVEIYDIVVTTERRRGIGRELIRQLIEYIHDNDRDAKLIFAITRHSNTIAQQFYESLGFRIVGRLHNFYRADGADEHALMYGLDL